MSDEARCTVNVTIHPWCLDPSRDEAVRAAEDGREGPLPTLEEAIAEAFANEAKCSPAVSETGEVQSGLRTERVTLEITHDGKHGPVAQWPFECGSHGKGVRVVEEFGTALPRVVEDMAAEIKRLDAERDAAIRERDTLRAEGITQALTADRFAAAVIEADTLRARVADLESQLESVACRAATAEMALESSGQADEEDANIGYALRLFVDGRRVLSHELDRQQAGAFLIAADHLAKYLRTEYQAQFDESAPAASELPPPAAFLDARHDPIAPTSGERIRAKKLSPAASVAAGTGWLTPEEQEAIMYLVANRSQFAPQTPHEERRNAACQVCHALIARSTPPEVVLPLYCGMPAPITQGVWDDCIRRVRAALAAAGVTVKEVGK